MYKQSGLEFTSPMLVVVHGERVDDGGTPASPSAIALSAPVEEQPSPVGTAKAKAGDRDSTLEPLVGAKFQVVSMNVDGKVYSTVVVRFAVSMAKPKRVHHASGVHHALTCKRRKYSPEEIAKALQLISHLPENKPHLALRLLHPVPGYESVCNATLTRWLTPKVPKKRGRKRNLLFEQYVLESLIYTAVSNKNNPMSVSILANVAYSYEIIKRAAELTQAMPRFLDDKLVKDLKFSCCWIKEFIEHATLYKRRVGSSIKVLPPPAEVQAHMAKIQHWMLVKEYDEDEVISVDETGIFYGVQPKYQYTVADAPRGLAPATDEKARITDMLGGSAGGNMMAHHAIVKCSSMKADLTKTRVLQNLMKELGFTAADGWVLKFWSRTITLKTKKGKMSTLKYTKPYLIHTTTKDVITIQHKAWMDTVGICMWIDVTLGPHFKAKRGKGGLIWDNCGSHCVDAVQPVLAEWGISDKKLVPNMTDRLQVMDLVANGPLKYGARRERAAALFDYFQEWKIRRLQAVAAGEADLPAFKPPKPTLAQGLLVLLKVGKEVFSAPSFKKGMARCFVKVGQWPQEDGTFIRYTAHGGAGSLLKVLVPGPSEAVTSLGSMAIDTDTASYEDEDEPLTDDDIEWDDLPAEDVEALAAEAEADALL